MPIKPRSVRSMANGKALIADRLLRSISKTAQVKSSLPPKSRNCVSLRVSNYVLEVCVTRVESPTILIYREIRSSPTIMPDEDVVVTVR